MQISANIQYYETDEKVVSIDEYIIFVYCY